AGSLHHRLVVREQVGTFRLEAGGPMNAHGARGEIRRHRALAGARRLVGDGSSGSRRHGEPARLVGDRASARLRIVADFLMRGVDVGLHVISPRWLWRSTAAQAWPSPR